MKGDLIITMYLGKLDDEKQFWRQEKFWREF